MLRTMAPRRRAALRALALFSCGVIVLANAAQSALAQQPTKSQEQEMTNRNTVPQNVTPIIIAATEADRKRAQEIIEVYGILSSKPTPEALSQYIAEGYIQHSTMVPDGYVGLAMVFSSSVSQYPVRIDVHRIMVMGEWAVAHVNFRNLNTTASDDLGTAAVDIYRYGPDGKIVEHWDVLQTVPTHSVNPNGMFLQVYDGD